MKCSVMVKLGLELVVVVAVVRCVYKFWHIRVTLVLAPCKVYGDAGMRLCSHPIIETDRRLEPFGPAVRRRHAREAGARKGFWFDNSITIS